MTHPAFISGLRRVLTQTGIILAILVWGSAVAVGPAAAQAAQSDWAQFQGGPGHAGSVASGPKAPFALGPVTTFDDLPGGSSESLGLAPPVVSGPTIVTVGPTSVRAISIEGGELWSVPRAFGPSVPAAIAGTTGGGIGCARCVPTVLYTEGWGAGPGDPTSSATPTTSVRPGEVGASGAATPTATLTPDASASGAPGPSPSPGAQGPPPAPTDLMARSLVDGSKMWDAPVELKATSRTGVTVDGFTAFVGDIRGNVYAVDVADGKVRWTANINGALESPIAAADGMLLLSVNGYSTDNAKLVALSEATGTVAWVYDTGHPGYLSAASAADGRAFVGVISLGAGATGSVTSLVSVDLAHGKGIWESQLEAPVTFATAPSIANDQVIVQDTSGDVVAVDSATGERNWMFALNTTFTQGALLVVGDEVLAPTGVGSLIVLDAATGHQLSRTADAGGPLHYPASVGSDRVIFTRGGPKPGLATFMTDPSGPALTDIASPTTPDYGKMLGNFAIAAGGLMLVSLLVFRPLSRKMGPAFLVEDTPTDVEENA